MLAFLHCHKVSGLLVVPMAERPRGRASACRALQLGEGMSITHRDYTNDNQLQYSLVHSQLNHAILLSSSLKINCSMTTRKDLKVSSMFFFSFFAHYALYSKLIGYAICYYSYSTWQGKSLALEDIYIRPAYRGNGYGELFFRALAKHAKESRCSRVDFHVLNWNPATKFYRRMGALDLTEAESWHFYRLQKDAIDRLLADDRQ